MDGNWGHTDRKSCQSSDHITNGQWVWGAKWVSVLLCTIHDNDYDSEIAASHRNNLTNLDSFTKSEPLQQGRSKRISVYDEHEDGQWQSSDAHHDSHQTQVGRETPRDKMFD